MATLIVRNVDEAIVKSLKERAKRNGRSMEAEHRALLEQLDSPRFDAEKRARFRELAEQARAMTKGIPQTPSEVLMREIRDDYAR